MLHIVAQLITWIYLDVSECKGNNYFDNITADAIKIFIIL